MKAYAITTIHRQDKDGKAQVIPASTAKKVSVFDADSKEFKDLEALGGVREATKDEIALAKSQAAHSGNAAFDDDAVDGDASLTKATDTSKPDSGAAGDPTSRPAKTAATKAQSASSKDDDLNL